MISTIAPVDMKMIKNSLLWFNFISILINNVSDVKPSSRILPTTATVETNTVVNPNLDQIDRETCTNPICVETANEWQNKMNLITSPCVDFHKYSCGKFASDVTTFSDAFQANNHLVINQIETLLTESSNDKEVVAIKEAKTFYATCLDQENLNNTGTLDLHLLISVLGGWGILDRTESRNFSWITYTSKFLQNGITPNHLLSFLVKEKSARFSFQVFYPKLSLPINILRYGLENEIVRAYYQFMKDVALLLGAPKDTVENDITFVLNFEIKLAQILDEDFDDGITDWRLLRWEYYHLYMTIEQATRIYPQIPWLQIVRNHLPENKFVTEQTRVVIPSLPWFRELLELLKYESKSVLADYLIWRAISKLGLISNPEINKIYHRHFHRHGNIFEPLSGIFQINSVTMEARPRKLDCLDATIRAYSLVLNYVYVKRFFDKSSKIMVRSIVEGVREEMETTIARTTLMSEKTKQIVAKILRNMVPCIGYGDQLVDSNKINEYYAKIPIKSNAFLDRYLTINAYQLLDYYSKLFKRTDRCDDLWPLGDYSIYKWPSQEFLISARFLQGKMFNHNLPIYVNLATIGVHIARLILTSVTDEFLANNIKSMWGENKYENITKIEQCTKNELKRLNGEFHNLPNTSTDFNAVIETIIDAISIKTIHRLNHKWLQNTRQPLMPAFRDHTANQLFWISFATFNCGKYERYVYSRTRLIMAARNSREFADDFDCPRNSNMNPNRRCDFWA